MPATVLDLFEICYQYRHGGVKDISFSAASGESIALFGEAGSGKTTLLRLLSGQLSPQSGMVRVFGRAPRSVRKKVGHAAENARLNPLFTAQQVVTHQVARQDVSGAQRPARVAEALELVGLSEVRDRPVRELSSGQRTALTIAAALAPRPALVVMDNLTAFLPPELSGKICHYLDARRAKDGLTLVHATTVSSEAERADRVLLLDAGCPLAFDTPDQLIGNHSADTVTIEAADPDAVQRTLRGIFDVEIEAIDGGLTFRAADGMATAAHLFRHPPGGVRTVYVQRPTLWDVIETLKAG
jgi:ABC-type multidrug transport system ATPase subunit